MRYQISGKQIDIGEALQTHVKTEIDAVIEKYHGRPTDANVVFSKNGSEYACECLVHLSTGLTVQSRGLAHEIYAALDNSVQKMEKQLRRYKRRLKDHHKDRIATPIDGLSAASYVLAPDPEEEIEGGEDADQAQPIIIAEMQLHIPSLSVGEAVMRMELAGAPVLVFRNEKQDMGVNIVYRRDDGNIGWIDPTQSA